MRAQLRDNFLHMVKHITHLGNKKRARITDADGLDDDEIGSRTSSPKIQKNEENSNQLINKQEWVNIFREFMENLRIQSKDDGDIALNEHLFGAQLRFLDEICDGLSRGIRHFVILKARQLGITTISLAMDLFWMAMHPGMQGALITDTEGNKEKFREIINAYLVSLPKGLKIKYNTNNRNMLVFDNGSILDYLVAGVRKKGGGLGRSRAYNFVHATECSSYGDSEGIASLMASLSEHHKDRIYIFESTARGFNLFYDMWDSAKNDLETQKPIFIGWWAKESYSISRASNVKLFEKYWDGTLSIEEKEKADICKRDYGVTITPEQWVWYRWKADSRMSGEGIMESEYPFHEREAFVATGKGFFPLKQVSMELRNLLEVPPPFEGYAYKMGSSFLDTEVLQKFTVAESDLKIWEYPNEKATYVMGVDPAYGRDENNDRSVIEVFRCYSDKLVQVAEYATPLSETHHLAWVMCHLAGNYKDCRINLELAGPGYAVMQEINHLVQMMKQGLLNRNFSDKEGMKNFFSKIKWYLYHKPDSMGAGFVYNWKTNSENKQTIFNQYRDIYMQKQLDIRSRLLFEEMMKMVQDGFEIHASGRSHDDRCMATALAVKAWIEWVRTPMLNARRTYEMVLQEEENSKKPYAGFLKNVYEDWMEKRKRFRENRIQNQEWEEDGEEMLDINMGQDDDEEEAYDNDY